MTTLRGVAASPGVGVGPAWVWTRAELDLDAEPVTDPDTAVTRLREGMDAVAADLEARAAAASGEATDVLEAQAAMALDPELAEAAAAAVHTGSGPARAVVEAGETYATALEASDNAYLAARAADVRDVCQRIARRLLGLEETQQAPDHPAVIVARDLAPADTAGLDPTQVRALVTEEGSRTSHTAILARELGVPAVVAVEGLLAAVADATVGVDGDEGVVYVGAEAVEQAGLAAHVEAQAARRAALREQAGSGPAATADGHRVEVAANVAGAAELRAALGEGAEGVGLLRTEFVYVDRRHPPSEDEQAALFEELAALCGRGRVVVRTFDFGADKPIPFLDMQSGPNPALGVRGIRLARQHPELLDTQLRAVVRAARAAPASAEPSGATDRRLAVMAPMVASVEEADWFIERAEAAGARAAGLEVGVMLEVPAAVLVAGDLAERCDFLSIGTNDLTQYLHAADRQEGRLAALQDPFAPAVLRAVAQVCAAAQPHRTWVGVCGESAGDPGWALLAVGLGVTELSMGTGALLEVRAALRTHALAECQHAAARALEATTTAEVRTIAETLLG